MLLRITFLSVLPMIAGASLPAQEQGADQVGREGMLDRITHPKRETRSPYQGKSFTVPGGGYDKTFSIKEYSGSKEYGSHSYATKGFASGVKSWFGDHLFPKKQLPENLSKGNSDASRKFDSKDFKTKDFSGLDKKSSYESQGSFATREITMKGKTQGAIDNNPRLEDAVRKGLSIDDVRKLLNKGP